MTATKSYEWLHGRFDEIATVNGILAILESDKNTVMPSGGAEARGEQVSLLSAIAHDLLTAPEVIENILSAKSGDANLNIWDARNLELMEEAYLNASTIPSDLIKALAKAQNICEVVWREARAKLDFSLVKSYLAEVVRLTQERGKILGGALSMSPYDALMNEFQRGVSCADVEPIFAAHLEFFHDILPKIEERQKTLPSIFPPEPVATAKQAAFCRELSEHVGLDYRHAYMSVSTHPGCGGIPTDIRLTTRYDESDYLSSLMGIIHETGHGIYDQGLPKTYAGQPVGNQAGMAIHESQSLLMEIQVCRSDFFLSWLGPKLHRAFGGDAAHYSRQNLSNLLRRVERSHIRVDADEVTYPAHIIHRFRLEKALISGDLAVKDLPSAWGEIMKDILEIEPPDDAHGCLQDIHWYGGSFGYYPSYTLGAMASAQLMAAAREGEPTINAELALGEFNRLRDWLRSNVHSKGSLYGFNDLLIEATGRSLDIQSYQRDLVSRYLEPS